MFVEESIVKTHLKSIYLKVGCVNKNKLLVLIMQAGLYYKKKQENQSKLSSLTPLSCTFSIFF